MEILSLVNNILNNKSLINCDQELLNVLKSNLNFCNTYLLYLNNNKREKSLISNDFLLFFTYNNLIDNTFETFLDILDSEFLFSQKYRKETFCIEYERIKNSFYQYMDTYILEHKYIINPNEFFYNKIADIKTISEVEYITDIAFKSKINKIPYYDVIKLYKSKFDAFKNYLIII